MYWKIVVVIDVVLIVLVFVPTHWFPFPFFPVCNYDLLLLSADAFVVTSQSFIAIHITDFGSNFMFNADLSTIPIMTHNCECNFPVNSGSPLTS